MQVTKDGLAMDAKSAREVDKFGKMYVRDNRISKANISGYYGVEIPGYEKLGLESRKIYQLYRPPQELEKAMPTFNGIPVLMGHPAENNTKPITDLAVGAVMNDIRFEFPYLIASISIWDEAAKAGIETDIQRELSPSYSYVPDMTPGSVDGEAYDGVMRNIHAYHLAIVPDGRTGPDVLVNDAKPEDLKKMADEKKADDEMIAGLKERLPNASDEDIHTVAEYINGLTSKANDEETKEDPSDDKQDNESEEDKEKRTNDDNDEDKKTANDAAILIQQAENKIRREFAALRAAERLCSPLIGEVACDSAEEVYRITLSQNGIDTKGVHPSALPKLVEMLKNTHNQPEPRVAFDSNSVSRVDQFLGAK